jgi:hypothetical protein
MALIDLIMMTLLCASNMSACCRVGFASMSMCVLTIGRLCSCLRNVMTRNDEGACEAMQVSTVVLNY